MKRVNKGVSGLFLGLLIVILSGCGTSHYYMLTSASTLSNHTASLPTIGVEKVLIPEYMQKGKVAIQRSTNEIVYLEDSYWAGDLSILLTQEAIRTVQKSFNHPGVYAYPWDFSKQPGVKIKISINRFISYGGFVYLDAHYTINDLRTDQRYSRLFSAKVPTGKKAENVTAAMSSAYGKLTATLSQELHRRYQKR